MCFDQSLTFLLCAMSMADILSGKTAEGVEGSLRSSKSEDFNQMWCLTAIARAMYSASVVEVATDFCFRHFQEMVECPS